MTDAPIAETQSTPTPKPTDALSWWIHLDSSGVITASGYTLIYHGPWRGGGGWWSAEHGRGRRRRQLGTAKTVEEAKALAQADHNRAGASR